MPPFLLEIGYKHLADFRLVLNKKNFQAGSHSSILCIITTSFKHVLQMILKPLFWNMQLG